MFDFDTALITDRTRKKDGEVRYAAIGFLYGKLHTLIFTKRGEVFRCISLRRANNAEEKSYDNT